MPGVVKLLLDKGADINEKKTIDFIVTKLDREFRTYVLKSYLTYKHSDSYIY